MREILFRGKRTFTREWVEGGLMFVNDYAFIMPAGTGSVEVITETVGAFTGLRDKNSKRIFEGDILKTWLEGGAHSGFSWPLGVVKFREGSFGIAHSKYKFTPLGSYSSRVYMMVVGNIHDNPELLKEEWI